MGSAKIEFQDNLVKKTYPLGNYEEFFSEIRALKRLNKCRVPYFPKMFDWCDEACSVNLEKSGQTLSIDKLPANHQEQLDEIARYLDRCGIYHREPYVENILINNGFLCLIDFGRSDTYDQGFSVENQIADNQNKTYFPQFFYNCDYIEQYPDETLFILSQETVLRSIQTDSIVVKRNPVYNTNLVHLKAAIGNL